MRRDPVPAYYRIYQALSERITGGVYPIGTKLPTDHEIMAEFSVSRHTARAAVEELVSRQLVRRFPGRGTFILENDPARPDWSARALEDLLIVDPEARFALHAIEYLEQGSAAPVAQMLRLPADQRIMRIAWSRVRPEGPIAYCAAHLPGALAARLPPDLGERLQTSRTIPLIEKFCGVQAFRVRQVSTAVAADQAMAGRLEVAPGTPLLLLQRTYFDVEGMPIYYSDLYVRSDRFQPKIELFRFRQQVELARIGAAD
ncbi:GntR family transcriptional regulator [Stella humosa]|uniref:GntR family transcriptional regulator n=1 Tax=Stella humosa TaxID=94 RepID=A0A3N1LHR8_9PROT|nr:GntR family transcriptional regulator [Stella humosa]ROP91077.1 GntR family transcriptional regulator [Stella humosa]BBK34573.1 GntR family transcriptional regulator [Stella humosa]